MVTSSFRKISICKFDKSNNSLPLQKLVRSNFNFLFELYEKGTSRNIPISFIVALPIILVKIPPGNDSFLYPSMQRFNINAITKEIEEWTCKVQVLEKGTPRNNLQKPKKYQLILLRDEEEIQVQCIIFDADITRYAELFLSLHTYLVSGAAVKESNNAYGPINRFTWVIDKGTTVKPFSL